MSGGRVAAWSALALGVFLFGACASAPPIPPPDWTEASPATDEAELTFISSGDTRRLAAEHMADRVIERLELGRDADLDAAPVSELRSELARAAAGELGAEVTGFAVTERAISRRDGVTLHWLRATYEREAFAATELALARHVQGGNPGPPLLRRARRRVEDGELVEGLRDYGRAVVETAGTAYAEDTLGSATRGTRELLDGVTISVERAAIQARVGEPFEEPLLARVRDTAREQAVAEMPVVIVYPEPASDGTFQTRTLYRTSDEDGRVTFMPPLLPERGEWPVTIALAPFFDLVTPSQEPSELIQLVEVARDTSAVLRFRSFSRAAQIPTGVFVVDTDIAGNPTGSMSTQRGLLTGFGEQGFSAGALPFDPRRFMELAEPDRVSLVRQRFDGEYRRVVLGTASLREFEEGDSVSVEVGGEVRVIDLDTGEEIYRAETTQRSRGNTASSAIAAAFRGLGVKLASDLALRLP
jgi:hypothetical protein